MKLNLKDKIELLDGQDVWHTKPFEGIPSVMMTDGPHGLRKQVDSSDHLGKSGSVKATAFPTASLIACSFDRNLIARMAELIAIEAKTNQVQIVLGPGINMKRSPLCGRNFEYFSEDPYLAGELGASYVKAMESLNVGTSVKHFFCNNQEKNRFFVDSIVDERTMREIYLKAFERIVKEKPASIMASYNKINGYYGTESPVIDQILRKEWGYNGVVVSDWGAISNRINSIKAGTDLEMPSSMGYRTNHVLKAAETDQELKDKIDESVARLSNLANTYQVDPEIAYDSMEHHLEARRIASESMVLLKNEDFLPLKENEKVLIISGFADDIRYQGGGSSHINPTHLDQISNLYQQYSSNIKIVKGFSISPDDDELSLFDEAVLASLKADKIIIIAGLPSSYETEGFDRTSLDLPYNQKLLIDKITSINPQVGVVVLTGSVVNLNFEPKVKSLLMSYLGGQGSAAAILDILYGKVNPSGRLAETFIDDIKDCNVELTNDNHSVHYTETIYIGYRYYQTFNKKVHYPFGYGLSYTVFGYSNFQVKETNDAFHILFSITNNGSFDGKDVVQIYIENNESAHYKANKELKQFEKIEVLANETKDVEIILSKEAFKFYDVSSKAYVIEKGHYKIHVARNVDDTIYRHDCNLDGVTLTPVETSYQDSNYNTKDFQIVYGKELPVKHMIKKRPYTMDSTLEDTMHTWIGRRISSIILKEGMKELKNLKDEWMIEVAKKTITETPLKMLALFSDGKVSFLMLEGLIDIMNLKIFNGILKIRKNAKEKKTA